MGENSEISWTDHTFNPWIGCTKVAAGCKHCYAEMLMDTRYGKVQWGPNGTRVLTTEANWKKPLKWNRDAEKAGVRARVFCSSLADVFEDWEGPMLGRPRTDVVQSTMSAARNDLFQLIDKTPHLDWLLLTKRPENVRRMWHWGWGTAATEDESKAFRQANGYLAQTGPGDRVVWDEPERPCFRPNVWLGTSIAVQADADKNIPELLKCRDLSPVLFLSMEPLMGAVDIDKWLWPFDENGRPAFEHRQYPEPHGVRNPTGSLDWVIVGGESGHNARPMHPDWARSLRDQCQAAGVPFHFKQFGEYGSATVDRETGENTFRQFTSFEQWVNKASTWVNGGTCLDAHGHELKTGGDFKAARDDGRFPVTVMHKVGKKAAGRMLDGRTWDEFPAAAVVSG